MTINIIGRGVDMSERCSVHHWAMRNSQHLTEPQGTQVRKRLFPRSAGTERRRETRSDVSQTKTFAS